MKKPADDQRELRTLAALLAMHAEIASHGIPRTAGAARELADKTLLIADAMLDGLSGA